MLLRNLVVARGGSRNRYEWSVCVLVIHRTTTVYYYGGARAVPGTVVLTWFDVADIFAACGTGCAKQDTTIRCCRYLCGTAVQSKIPQSGTVELQDVAELPFDVLAARIPPFNWEEFFARIPIEEQMLSKQLTVIFLVARG